MDKSFSVLGLTKRELMFRLLLCVFLAFCYVNALQAKSYSFDIEKERSVSIYQSASEGTKIVKVVATGGSADKAIDIAMQDAVVALSFWGASGEGEMSSVPAILKGGRETYDKNETFFKKFFKKGGFIRFVHKVNSLYPTGTNNVKTSKGRKITILLIVDWKELAEYYKSQGLETCIMDFSNY